MYGNTRVRHQNQEIISGLEEQREIDKEQQDYEEMLEEEFRYYHLGLHTKSPLDEEDFTSSVGSFYDDDDWILLVVR